MYHRDRESRRDEAESYISAQKAASAKRLAELAARRKAHKGNK